MFRKTMVFLAVMTFVAMLFATFMFGRLYQAVIDCNDQLRFIEDHPPVQTIIVNPNDEML